MTCAVSPNCEQPAIRAATDRGCLIHSADPTVAACRLAGSQRGGRVAADCSRLRSRKHAQRYLEPFAAALASNPSPATIAAAETAQRLVETALKLLDVQALQYRVRELEDHVTRCRKEKRIP